MRSRGGALIELVVWTGVLTLLVASSYRVATWGLWRLRTISIARFATVLAGTGRVAPSVIQREVESYVQRLAGSDRATVAISINRFSGVASAAFYKLIAVETNLDLGGVSFRESFRTEQEGT
jgi:hypothetical protein